MSGGAVDQAAPALQRAADTGPLLSLCPQTDGTFRATAPERLCVGIPGKTFLFGGIAFAAGIEAMERVAGAPASVAAAQFAAKAGPGETLTFTPGIAATGNAFRQGTLELHAGERMMAAMQGAFGRRNDHDIAFQGAAAPVVPAPVLCPHRSVARLLSSNVESLFEFRLAAGDLPDRADWTAPGGRDLACWVSLRSGGAIARLMLPVIADCAAIALPGALGRPASGVSLDNTIRFASDAECEHVLFHARVEAVDGGIAHITSRIYAPGGAMLALAAQSMIVRARPPE